MCYNEFGKPITGGTTLDSIITQFKSDLNTLCKFSNVLLYFLDMLEAADKSHDAINALASNPEVVSLIQNVGDNMEKLTKTIGPIASDISRKDAWAKAKPKPRGKGYANFEVDEPPLIDGNLDDCPEKYNFDDYLRHHKAKTGRELKPIKTKTGQYKIDYDGCCPECGAPREYLYDNVVSMGQLLCKCCKTTFTTHKTHLNKITLRCPHCKYALVLKHDRKGYNVYTCPNNNCTYRVKRINTLKNRGIPMAEIRSGRHKVRYLTRVFDINYEELEKMKLLTSGIKDKLSNINNPQIILGLVLTYYSSYALSSRKTAAIMNDVHEVDISHQTVLNYATYTAKVIEPFLEGYKYNLSNIITGDETYIKIAGKHAYVFFFSDSNKKIITSYHVFRNRDTLAAIKSMYQSIKKYQGNIPKDLEFITDGNPIYRAHKCSSTLKVLTST